MSSFPLLFAQVTNAVSTPGANPVDAAASDTNRPIWSYLIMYGLLFTMVYFAFFRPSIQAKKKQEDTIKTAKTGDKIITSSGIHGIITNVKETSVIVRVADNVKLEIEKSHIDKITRESDSEKPAKA